MPPPTPNRLDELYRRSQLRLRAVTMRDVIRLWSALDWAAIADTYPAWSLAMRTLVERNQVASRQATQAYLAAAWTAAGLAGAPDFPKFDFNLEQVETSIRITSLVAYRRGLAAGMPAKQAIDNALVQVNGSSARLVLEAGRSSAVRTATSNGGRWARLTSPDACSFCLLLSGRGYVYRSEETASFDAHDHCGCTAIADFSGAAGRADAA